MNKSRIMPTSSFFSGLDQVSEQQPTRKNSQKNNVFPSSLQDSPYLTSPIRPIPSFSKKYSSNMSVSSKRSKKYGARTVACDNRTMSPSQSTVGSLRLTSPFSDSIFSLHSLCTSSKKVVENERQSLSRTVLLPHEIDILAKQFHVTYDIKNNDRHNSKEDIDDDNGDVMSDFDDDSTIASDIAKSINDDNIYEKLQLEEKEEALYNIKQNLPKEISIEDDDNNNETTTVKNDRKQKQDTAIHQTTLKLPSVNTGELLEERTNDKSLVPAVVQSNKQMNLQPNNNETDISPDSAFKKRSPYAVNQSRAKLTNRKKKKVHNKPKDFRY